MSGVKMEKHARRSERHALGTAHAVKMLNFELISVDRLSDTV